MTARIAAPTEQRRNPRYYLPDPLAAEVILGRRRFAAAPVSISDVSAEGVGLRCPTAIVASRGTPITVAVRLDDGVLTLGGSVESVSASGLGMRVDPAMSSGSPMDIAENREVVSVHLRPGAQTAAVTGKLTMNARHAVRWAVVRGVTRFDIGGVSTLDSSGLGLLLHFHQQHRLTVESCPARICDLLGVIGQRQLCPPGCAGVDRRRPAAAAPG